ncbi:hypothetical protein PHMEG_00027953 [Phytophthora megakarya]|uniref:Peptidase A2 domain-containing protein n=1 Tax=Phytophthora megakarya TaxID=4795 RepID=A0A225V6M8_9STRA|nr:hypothetical protein PHMEG_00027953 [Phytophthora megakarya]
MLISISHQALLKWRNQRREYEAKMIVRCRASGEDYDAVTQPVKESFDTDLLEALCTLRLRKEVEDVTEDMLITELDALLGKVKNGDVPDVKALFKSELQMDLKETDVDARVLSYFQQFKKVVEENGLVECLSGPDSEVEKCKLLISCLAPPVLKADVKTAVRWTNKEASKSVAQLYSLVYEKAVEHERHFQQNKRMRVEQQARGKKKAKTAVSQVTEKETSSGKKGGFQNKKKNPQSKDSTKPEEKVDKKAEKVAKTTRNPPSPCPKCQEMHWLSDCTKATDSEKVELRKQLREANKARKSRTKRLSEFMPATDRTVTINGVLELPCCPDTGSDYTIISRAHWNLLQETDPTVLAEPLDTPVQSLTFGGHLVVANQKTSLHVRIHTAAGAVEPAEPVKCLIVEANDNEFMIGKDLLGILGIDVDRQLELLASRGGDETSGDPFDLEADELPVNSTSPATDEQVRAAVETLIERALEHGFPADKVEKLRLIVYAYDVWRLELRDDPPARVPPLEVRLKAEAQPSK